MKKLFISTIAILTITVLFIGCGSGSEQKSESKSAADDALMANFPDDFSEPAARRTSDVEVYVGDSLYEYIDGGAELYHTYNFKRVLTASYDLGGDEVIYDIYEFAEPEGAYGLYSMLRPDYVETLDLGVEGFSAGSAVDFVKGNYLIVLTGFTYTDEFTQTLTDFAQRLDKMIEGKSSYPQRFDLFPAENKMAASDKIISESFLGHEFLTDVYSSDYQINSDTVTLFMAADPSGSIHTGFESLQADDKIGKPEIPGLDQSKIFLFYDSYEGHILVINDNGTFKGMVGYKPEYLDLMKSWIISDEK